MWLSLDRLLLSLYLSEVSNMNFLDVTLILIILAWIVLAIIHEVKIQKKGGCEYCGLSGTCPFKQLSKKK